MRSIVAATFLFIAAPLVAATFTVTNGGDSGVGTLRWAIELANATPGADTIEWNDAMTVILQSPLPPITEAVTIGTNPLPYWPSYLARPPRLTIDGSQTSGDGLRISGNDVVVSSVAVTHFKSGIGVIVDGNDAILNWIDESDAGNGLRLHGLRAGIYGSRFTSNQDTGLFIDSSSRDNMIGRMGRGCVPTGDCDGSPTGNAFDTNGIGMRVDGEHNSFIFTEASGNRADGALVSGAGNRLDSLIAILNGGNGVTLLAPAAPPLVASCNGGMPYDVGGDGPTPDEDRAKSRLAAPRITAGTRYFQLMTVSGDAHAAPNRQLLVAIYVAVNSNVDCERYLGQVGSLSRVTTNAAGDAHFELSIPGAGGEALYAAVTELDEDGNATATSELSAPFSPLNAPAPARHRGVSH